MKYENIGKEIIEEIQRENQRALEEIYKYNGNNLLTRNMKKHNDTIMNIITGETNESNKINDKYELTNEKIYINNKEKVLYRIRALKDFNNVEKGELGGYIESEKNLSFYGNSWVYGNARVYDDARVYGDAKIYGNAKVYGNARVYSNSIVSENTEVFDNVTIGGSSEVYGNAVICENVDLDGHSKVHGTAIIYGNATLKDSEVASRTKICGNTNLVNNYVDDNKNYITLGPIGSRDGFTTFVKQKDKIYVNCGCFSGDIDEFKQSVIETHHYNTHAVNYLSAIDFVRNKFNSNRIETHSKNTVNVNDLFS